MRTTAPNAEINRELAIISKAYTLGIQGKLVSFRPHIPKLKENNRRKGFFEREQFVTVRSYLPQPIQALTTCGYITGWRIKSEVQPLTWPQVNLGEGGVIRLEGDGTKNEEPREFPIAGEPRTVLETQAAKADALLQERGVFVEHAFFWEDGSPIKDFRGSWETACIRAGLAEKVKVGEDDKGNAIFSWKKTRVPHDFRRTAVRNLIRAGVDRDTAKKLVGHKTDSVFSRYNIVDMNDLQQAAQKLDEYYRRDGQRLGKVTEKDGQFRMLDSRK